MKSFRNWKSSGISSSNISPSTAFTYVSLFDLSDNHHKRISGRISTSFGDKQSVESLDLSHDILTGEIPGTFANLLEPRT
ncbi:hypothetical protein SADUNF_Sadunf19G0040400 [Salix dunnii]|uniref:Uncharacterized protein n=1 Tax=Salix dunnii TaxID=1413687 RepID=A0A835MHL0_9ROSI|nr:hypothetical protein SADUNF_Sadunf19G0040400 [Salix dunnii]